MDLCKTLRDADVPALEAELVRRPANVVEAHRAMAEEEFFASVRREVLRLGMPCAVCRPDGGGARVFGKAAEAIAFAVKEMTGDVVIARVREGWLPEAALPSPVTGGKAKAKA